MNRMSWALCALGSALVVAGQTSAQQASGQGADTLQEVVITAERREENLQKTSISIATVSGDDIAEQGRSNVEDILKNVPSVVVVGTARGATVSIRGLGFDLPPQVGENSVSMNFDGIYNFRSEAGTYGYFDLARVEVLRGPQGTLYGRNATGGVVNIISNNPGRDFGARGSLEVGSYNLLRAEGALNVPLSANSAARASFVSINRDGYLTDGKNDAVGSGGRLKYLYSTSEAFSLLTSIEYAKIGGHGPGTVDGMAYDAGNTLTGVDVPYASNFYESTRYSVQLDASIGPGVLTFLPSYQTANGYNYSQGMGAFARTDDPIFARQTSGELRYASAADAAIKWVVGLFYYDKKDSGQAFGGIVNNDTRSTAVFGQVTYPLGDTMRLIGGARHSWDDKQYFSLAINPNTNSDKQSAFDWKVGVEKDLAAASMLYLTAASGHRPGGFNILADNTAALVRPGQFYDPESLISLELGSKNRFMNDRMQINGAVFYYDYKDYQLADIYSFVGGLRAQFVNADARITGAELELQTLVGEGGQFDLGLTTLQGELKEAVTRNNTTVFFSGDTLSHSPDLAIKAGFEYRFPLASGSLTPRLDYRHTSEQYVNAVNNAANLQKAYGTYDATLTWRSADEKWSLNFYGKNLSNEIAKLFLAGPNPQVSMPRNYGVVFSARM